MKIAFFSNFLNHHQLPLCEAFLSAVGEENFRFVATMSITKERLELGYLDMNEMYSFVVKEYLGGDEKIKAEKLALESDVMIFGAAPLYYQDLRLNANKIVFHYNERFFKHGKWGIIVPKIALRTYNTYIKNKDKKLYVLCAGAYVEHDLRFIGFETTRCYKWGYFPPLVQYDIMNLFSAKKNNTMIWVGRLIDWKHPEYVIEAAKLLKVDGYSFEINIIGKGPLYDSLVNRVAHYRLNDFVHVLGVKSNEEVRHYMEESQILLFTSNRQEGWGAVLNEAMNSACVPVASHMIGATPYLIKDGYNGLVFKSGDIKSLYITIKKLLDNPEEVRKMSHHAYETIVKLWNADKAVQALLHLNETITNNKDNDIVCGPGSNAGHYSECF